MRQIWLRLQQSITGIYERIRQNLTGTELLTEEVDDTVQKKLPIEPAFDEAVLDDEMSEGEASGREVAFGGTSSDIIGNAQTLDSESFTDEPLDAESSKNEISPGGLPSEEVSPLEMFSDETPSGEALVDRLSDDDEAERQKLQNGNLSTDEFIDDEMILVNEDLEGQPGSESFDDQNLASSTEEAANAGFQNGPRVETIPEPVLHLDSAIEIPLMNLPGGWDSNESVARFLLDVLDAQKVDNQAEKQLCEQLDTTEGDEVVLSVNEQTGELPDDEELEEAEPDSDETGSVAESRPQPKRILEVDNQPITLQAMIESLLFVAEEPAEPRQFAEVLDVPVEEVEEILQELTQSYLQQGSGLRVQQMNGRYTIVTVPVAAQAIEDFLNLDLNSRLSSAALETLAIVAYRQPVTRSQIEAIRGVDCGGVIRTLLQRELILESGRMETAGRPILYAISTLFMQHFGLTHMNELPPLETTDADLLWAATQLTEEVGESSNTPNSIHEQ